jgi:heptosyltransferase-3
MKAEKIIVSRTDHIGDVVLTLPMVGILRRYYPSAEIVFLGNSYTQAAIDACEHTDGFLAWDAVAQLGKKAQKAFLQDQEADAIIHVYPRREIAAAARAAGIPCRIGTSHRSYHLWSCNKWIHFTRRKSDLHESQLNVKLLKPLGVRFVPMLTDLPSLYGLTKVKPLTGQLAALLRADKLNLIVHPTTAGNAKSWSPDNYARLIESLPPQRYQVFVTGTDADRGTIEAGLPLRGDNVTSLVGKTTLTQLISFISRADAMVCASTGPVHLAAALGKCAIGIYSPKGIGRPGRYGPVGKNAHTLVYDPNCERCLDGLDCDCLQDIPVSAIKDILDRLADDSLGAHRGRRVSPGV